MLAVIRRLFAIQLKLLPIRFLYAAPLCLGVVVFAQSCGVVGPPIAPEDIGIEAKIRKQNQADVDKGENAEQLVVPIEQEEVQLPPLKPLGSQ